jgi:hypothetical protein
MSELRGVLRTYVDKKFDERAKERGLRESFISNGDYFDIENKCPVTRFNKNCMVLYMNPEPALISVLEKEFGNIKDAWLSMCASGNARSLNRVPTDIITLTKRDLIEFIKKEYTTEFAFEVMLLIDDEFKQKTIDEQRQKGNQFMSHISESPLFNDSDRECELVHLLSTLLYDNNDIGTVVKYYHEDHMEDFPETLLYKGEFRDNRLYLPWDDNMCLVLSKNPYDYIWASTGNGYQSCFSLESDYWGIQAMPMLATQPWHFMMYWSKCTLNEYSIMNHKFKLPNIQVRSWAYKSGDKLAFDKRYGRPGSVIYMNQLLEEMYPEFSKRKCSIDMNVDDFTDIVEKYRTYLDSLTYEGDFCFGDGERRFTTDISNRAEIKESVSRIFYNPDLRWKEGIITTVHNNFCYVQVCPKTKLPTEGSEHWAAKYIDRPVKSMAIFGYQVDAKFCGLYLVDASHASASADYNYWYRANCVYESCNVKNINDLKKALTECQEKHPQVECILLRIVNRNKVTFQPFYAREEPKFK